MATSTLELDRAIMIEKPSIAWSEVAGLEEAKEVLFEAIISPIKFPHLVEGKPASCKRILLFGPPGTGKSYLVRAAAAEANHSTILSVSASYVISTLLSDLNRLIQRISDLVHTHKPCIILVEEVDSLCSSRSDEREETQRLKTEFLGMIQAMQSYSDGIFVLSATSTPWMLNSSIRQFFDKRVYISLPEENARFMIFKSNLGNTAHYLTEDNLHILAGETNGCSGADIVVVVRDALMQPVREIQSATYFKQVSGSSPIDKTTVCDDLLAPCSPDESGAIKMSWMEMPSDKLFLRPVTMTDMLKSLHGFKPAVGDMDKFDKFREDFGQEG
ncbi:vacuolar protein sorting-associated protein 4-like [Sabethes cyaneus]|uniref:vacuolar protein sorting-associated protein 4-like n=1 Tax=Sabethes cyaneus TaxID=53552 RepID=UPI00237DE634|nr:vacuolar protein sorting-associated protein 4-like [Sabethes cyaneus]